MNNKICLNMIVKNESNVIIRCLESVCDLIDYYVICDTGSTDSTINDINKFMHDRSIPGFVKQHEWKDFAHNRNLALKEVPSKMNYVLFIDADDELCLVEPYHTQHVKKWMRCTLMEDLYHVKKDLDGVLDLVPFLIKLSSNLRWEWHSPVHNQLKLTRVSSSETRVSSGKIEINQDIKTVIIANTIMYIMAHPNQGAKSHEYVDNILEKYLHDALVLEDEPDKTDMQLFHLAQSYFDGEDWVNAIQAYKNAYNKIGDNLPEIKYYCMFRMGVCAIRLEYEWESVRDMLLAAHQYRPTRVEAVFELVKYCHDNKLYYKGYQFGKLILDTLRRGEESITDNLLVDRRIYRQHFWDKYAICAYYSGHLAVSIQAFEHVLKLGYCDEYSTQLYKKHIKHMQDLLTPFGKTPFGNDAKDK